MHVFYVCTLCGGISLPSLLHNINFYGYYTTHTHTHTHTQPFGTILDLVPLAESVVKLKAVCMVCFKDAAFTKRLGSEKEIEVIGGADKYMAVCRTCHNMPDRKALTRSEHTPTRGGGDITLGRQLFPDDH